MARRIVLQGRSEETWGEMVKRHVLRDHHLLHLAREIEKLVPIGSSPGSFKNLFELEDVPAKKRDRFRAYYLLVAAQLDPLEFGLTSEDGPEPSALYMQLKDVSRWIGGIPVPDVPENTDSQRPDAHRRIAA